MEPCFFVGCPGAQHNEETVGAYVTLLRHTAMIPNFSALLMGIMYEDCRENKQVAQDHTIMLQNCCGILKGLFGNLS